MAKKPPWVRTLITQLSLCFALYLSLNVGQPQKSIYQKTNGISGRKSLDFYFISVTGGFRPLEQQTLLLKQMEHVAKSYDTRFVVNTSELGEDDPLKENATRVFPSLKVPWYNTKASKEKEVGCFQEQIKLPHGGTLDIIGVDTGSLQNAYLSKHGCIKYAHQDSITYIENPGQSESGNGREMVDGFLLHRVSSFEIV